MTDRPTDRTTDGETRARRIALFAQHRALVVEVAADFRGRGLPWEDLLQEGEIGLWNASGTYEPEQGAPFSHYAGRQIRWKIERAVKNGARVVHVPEHLVKQGRDIRRIAGYLRDEFHREPTPEEIAEKLEVPPEAVRSILEATRDPQDNLHDSEALDDLPAEALSPLDSMLADVQWEQLRKVLKTLTSREEQVLRMRFGFPRGSEPTLDEVAERFEVSSERMAEIKDKALRKVRHPGRAEKLKSFIKDREKNATRDVLNSNHSDSKTKTPPSDK